ncbi:MAG TPA: MBL fold metallo-hydrolase [Acidimicrobiales bacterium]|jgi:phosphoribosyl 1,2-cyclic phosphodiesterase|nr:MBL fold metallo-hydrolase [Acidimicrobiales bacterium]
MRVTFYGVRGSTPCDSPDLARYGGNTSCVAIEVEGQPPIVFDMGTGLRAFGNSRPKDGQFQGAVLLTHLHWDHIQGLPFFGPVDRESASLAIYGPQQEDGPLGEVFTGIMRPPYFPIRPHEVHGQISFHDAGDDVFTIGEAKVTSRWVRHNGPTLGYRIDWNGYSVTYISDHGPGTSPEDADDHIPRRVLELCSGVDLLIHDAQYTPEEYEEKRGWGHCTVDYAVHVAHEAGAKDLVMFHHDPWHADAMIDKLLCEARDTANGRLGVHAAYEGMILELDNRPNGLQTGLP